MVSLAYPRFSRHGRTLYFQRLLKGFSNRLVEQGVEPVFHYLDLHQDAELRFLQNVSLNGAEGLALMPHYRSREECELVEELCDGGFPCVLFDHSLPGLQADFVGTANRQAFQRLTDELLSRGHDRLGYVAYNLEHSVMEDRLAGYRCSLARAGIPYREEQVVNCEIIEPDQRLEKALSAARTIERLITGETPPTAFVCSDGLTASFLCECLNRRGLEVPGDVEIATVDDNADPNEDVRLPWLIALQDGAEIGRLTADLLLARIAQPDKNIEQHYVQVRFLFERYDALSEKQRERTKGR